MIPAALPAPLPAVPPRAPAGGTAQPPQTDLLEASFLEEMLRYMRPGGAPESEFQSFLDQQYASRLAARIDLGIAIPDRRGTA